MVLRTRSLSVAWNPNQIPQTGFFKSIFSPKKHLLICTVCGRSLSMAQHIWSFEPDSLSGTLPTPGLVGSSSIRQRRYWAYCYDVAAQTATLITLLAALLSTTILCLPFPLLHSTQKLPAGSVFDRLMVIPSRNLARRGALNPVREEETKQKTARTSFR